MLTNVRKKFENRRYMYIITFVADFQFFTFVGFFTFVNITLDQQNPIAKRDVW